MSELEDRWFWAYPTESVDCDGITGSAHEVYSKSDVDAVIAEKDKEIAGLKEKVSEERSAKVDYKISARDLSTGLKNAQADYREACDRLHTANLIKDEQKAKADKLLSALKCLVMRGLIKDCPEKASAIEIVREYEIL